MNNLLIHKGIPIPLCNRYKLYSFTKKLLKAIETDEMKIGDMVECKHDCNNVRNRLYSQSKAICVRFDRRREIYQIWRVR
jgi:hypothetical protein